MYYIYHSFVTANDNYILFDQIKNKKIQFTFLSLTKSSIDENNENYKELTELFNFNIDINCPKILLNNSNIFIHIFGQNQLCLVKYNLNKINNIKSIEKKNINEIKLIQKNDVLIAPEKTTSSGIYNKEYDVINLFKDDGYYCSNFGKIHHLKFAFDDEYNFLSIKFVFRRKNMDCRPKKFCIEITDSKERFVNMFKIENKDNNKEITESIDINEFGKYIGLTIFDNYGGEFIIIKRIYFYAKVINIIKREDK